MPLADLKKALGIDRIVWIDDVFAVGPETLAELLTQLPAAVKDFPELAGALERSEFSSDGSDGLAQAVADLAPERRGALQDALFEAERKQGGFATDELSSAVVATACRVLGIAERDRWTFDEAERQMSSLSSQNAGAAYVIDLNQRGGPDERGLDILASLVRRIPGVITFILTHTAQEQQEWHREDQLSRSLADRLGGMDSPGRLAGAWLVTVVSKQRVAEEASVEDGFAVGLKRAGLRLALRDVLISAEPRAAEAFGLAARTLLGLPPESLEVYVFERGYDEGISPMHVVERAVAGVM